MKIKQFFKRFLAWIGATVMLLAVVGCAKTPDESVLAETNTEKIIEVASISNAQGGDTAVDARPLAERLGVPETLQWSFASENHACAIHIDAPIIVPDADMSIVRVRPAQFTQEQVTKAFQAFCGNTPMYQTVPSSDERIRSDGTLQTMQMDIGGSTPLHYIGVEASSETPELLFQVRNDCDNTETITIPDYDDAGNETGGSVYGVQRGAAMFCANYDATFSGGACNSPQNRVYRGDAISQAAQPYIELTPDDAYDIADKWLTDIGVSDSFVVADVFLEQADMGSEEAEPGYYYDVECVRLANGIPCASLRNYHASTLGSTDLGGDYQSWTYESLNLTITKKGLAIAFWTGPLDIVETVSENVSLKPFAEIEEIAKKTLPLMHEKRVLPEWGESTEVKIDRVVLSLQRIVDQTQFDSGLLIPVWNFYGTLTDSRTGEETDAQSGSMLSINAIDGNIVDVERGY